MSRPGTGGPGRHLVEHGAEGEQIGALVEFFAARLLRRHVGDGAEHQAGAGEVLVGHFGRLGLG